MEQNVIFGRYGADGKLEIKLCYKRCSIQLTQTQCEMLRDSIPSDTDWQVHRYTDSQCASTKRIRDAFEKVTSGVLMEPDTNFYESESTIFFDMYPEDDISKLVEVLDIFFQAHKPQ